MFNRAVPNIKLSWTGASTFVLSVGVPAPSLLPPFEVGELPSKEIPGAIEGARRFLVALSIASQGVYTWRAIATPPHGVGIRLPGEEEPRELEVSVKPFTIDNAPTLHPGFLFGALDITANLHTADWSPRFFALYLRGIELLAAGGDFLGTYFEEAYLCFYRCVEYAVMVKILDQRGQFNDHRFADAVTLLGGRPADVTKPLAVAREVLRRRNTSVAHFLKGSQDSEVSVQDVGLVKNALDILTAEYVKHAVRAGRG